MEHCVQPHAYETQRYFSPTKPVTSTQHRQNPNTHTTHKTLNWTIHWSHKINRCSSNGYSTFAQSRQCSVG